MILNALDKFTRSFAPQWTLNRVRARAALDVVVRHYEAAQPGRRTSGWARSRGDANVVNGVALAELRMHARDLVRNDGWARKARRVIANHTVGWGIVPRPSGPEAATASAVWKAWAGTTQCDSEGRLTFAGIQSLCMRTIPQDGEFLIRRRFRRVSDGLTIPLQLQVLEADYLDISKDLDVSVAGGPIIQGVEYDKRGRRTAYWLFAEHPGSRRNSGVSERVPASDIIHVFYVDRVGQVRGVSWFGAAIVPLKDLGDFDDAELLKQKIAACFAAFVTDAEGEAGNLGEASAENPLIDVLEPGMVAHLPPGKQVTTASPPSVVEGSFSTRKLRKVASTLGVTYEDLTGDYSLVNFSSGRMGRLAHWADVREWQGNMVIPQLCQGVWTWAMEAAVTAGLLSKVPLTDWTAPPMPMLEPDKEAIALRRLVRAGALTPSGMVRELGEDPETHWNEMAEDFKGLDKRGLVLDIDPRKTSDSGLTQERPATGGGAKKDE